MIKQDHIELLRALSTKLQELSASVPHARQGLLFALLNHRLVQPFFQELNQRDRFVFVNGQQVPVRRSDGARAKKSIEEQKISERNMLDELKRKTASYKETVETIDSILEEGYDPEDVKSMALGLKAFGIKGDPEGSVTRLVEGLKDVKDLAVVEEKLRRKQEELANASRARDQVKDELGMASTVTLKAIEEVRKAAEQGIAAVGEQTRNETLQMARKFELGADESIRKIDARLQEEADTHKIQLEELTELEHRKAEVEQVLGPGLALAGALKSPEALKTVSASFITQLLERIQSWFELNMPDALLRPTEARAMKIHLSGSLIKGFTRFCL